MCVALLGNNDNQVVEMRALSRRHLICLAWLLHQVKSRPVVVISKSEASLINSLESSIAERLIEEDPCFSWLFLMQLKFPVTNQGSDV